VTWANENGRAVIRCDGAGCTRTVDALEDDWITAATKATARGWYVPDTIGREASLAARDYCAACRPASTVGAERELADNIARAASESVENLAPFVRRKKPSAGAWPTEGITSAGHWGSPDGIAWERVNDGELVVGDGRFVAGWIVNTPDKARWVMRECLPPRSKEAAK
jgi:hypothetical protein